jgi:hypothetical protein
MQRILRSTVATLTVTFEVDGVATDPVPADCTVEIVRDDGTVLVASTPAQYGTTGQFSYTLGILETADLDILTANWTSALGVLTTTVEVVGGFLFTLSEARQTAPLDNLVRYPTSQLVQMRTLVEQALEDACGVAFVPRYARETRLNGQGGGIITTKWAHVTAIRSATIDGTLLTAGELADINPTNVGLYKPSGWALGYGNVEVAYEHGDPHARERVSRAVIRLAKRWLVEGPVDDRATSFSNDDGTYSLVTPGRRDELFDLPEVNAVRKQYNLDFGIA